VQIDVLEYGSLLVREGALLCAHPAIDLLLDHLEQALGVHRIDIDLCLKATVLGRPGQRLSYDAIRPELGEAFVHCVEDALVQDVLALLADGG